MVTNYTLHGKNVVHMTRGSDDLHFFYDAQNKPAVVVYNGTAYAQFCVQTRHLPPSLKQPYDNKV